MMMSLNANKGIGSMGSKIPPPGGLPLPGAGGKHVPELMEKSDTGGVKLGKESLFVRNDQMPSLELDRIIKACDHIIGGTECYSALLYLNRAKLSDLEDLMEATRSPDVKERWQRLWVLSSTFARLARSLPGQVELSDFFEEDLAALHMFSKFDPKNNSAARKFFERLHDELLKRMVKVLVRFRDDSARSALLGGIVAIIENDSEVLRTLLASDHSAAEIESVLGMIPFEDSSSVQGRGNVSSQAILERLRELSGQDSGEV